MVENLPPGDLNVGDGETVTVEISAGTDISAAAGARGGTTWTLKVRYVSGDGRIYNVRGGKRLWDAVYPVLSAAPAYPVKVVLTAIGAPGSTARTWKATKG